MHKNALKYTTFRRKKRKRFWKGGWTLFPVLQYW